MNPEVAEKLSVLMLRVAAQLDQSVAFVRDHCDRKEYEAYRSVAGRVIGTIYVDIEEKLWMQHPHLRPDSLGGKFKLDAEVLGPPFYSDCDKDA